MSELIITDSTSNGNITYIYGSINNLINELNGKVVAKSNELISNIKIQIGDYYIDYVKKEIEDKIADCIAINYKYKYLKKRLKICGLNKDEYEMLLSALISADLEEDKRYVLKKVRSSNIYSIDGVFNFRIKPLINKWKDVISYIPTYFSLTELKEFICYLTNEKKGKKVYIENGVCYDNQYKKLQRSELLPFESKNVVNEVILSGCSEIEVVTSVSDEEAYYLNQFYENKIFYRKDIFS